MRTVVCPSAVLPHCCDSRPTANRALRVGKCDPEAPLAEPRWPTGRRTLPPATAGRVPPDNCPATAAIRGCNYRPAKALLHKSPWPDGRYDLPLPPPSAATADPALPTGTLVPPNIVGPEALPHKPPWPDGPATLRSVLLSNTTGPTTHPALPPWPDGGSTPPPKFVGPMIPPPKPPYPDGHTSTTMLAIWLITPMVSTPTKLPTNHLTHLLVTLSFDTVVSHPTLRRHFTTTDHRRLLLM